MSIKEIVENNKSLYTPEGLVWLEDQLRQTKEEEEKTFVEAVFGKNRIPIIHPEPKPPKFSSFLIWASQNLTIEELKDEYAKILSKQSQLSKRQRDIIEQLYREKCS